MKKIFLLTILLFQLTFVFGQTPIAEDEKVIQYSTKWGAWVAAAGNNNILFSARLKWYDKKTKLYAWDVRHKVLKVPIAFEWKITNQVFTGASDNVEGNDGYYKTATFDSKDNSNSMNGSGFAIYSTSKTTLYYQVRNVCYEFDGRNPNCETTNNKATSKNNQQNPNSSNTSNSSSSLSVEQLENIIINNLNGNLKDSRYSFYDKYNNANKEVLVEKIQVGRDAMLMGDSKEPNTLYIFYYDALIDNRGSGSWESKLFMKQFTELNIQKVNKDGANFLYFQLEPERFIPAVFSYNFGANDKNFIELQNAIEALKNPNKKNIVTSKQSGNVQKTQEKTKTMSIEEANQYLTLADTAYTEGRIEDAKKHYLESIESFPNYKPDAYFNLGVITTNEGKTVEAEKYYLKTIELFPDYKDAYLNLCALRLEKEKVIINEMNKLGTTQSDIIKYNNLLKKRNQLLKNALPFLEKYRTLDGDNSEVNKTLIKYIRSPRRPTKN